MPTKEGRVTLTDTRFKTIENGNTTETDLSNDDEFNAILKKYLKLDLESIQQYISTKTL